MYFSELLAINPDLKQFVSFIPPELDGQFVVHRYEGHKFIQKKETDLTHIGILLQGSFRVINELENGNVFMIEVNDAVSFIGEVTLLAKKARTSVALETITPCVIATMPLSLFDRWLNSDIRFLRAVSTHVAQKLYFSSYHRGERNFYSAKYVLLKYILNQITEIRGGKGYRLNKTRQDMSEEIGMSINTINRNIQSFRQDGLLSIEKGKIVMTLEEKDCAQNALSVFITQNRNGTKSD